jgi:hypothetical protein
MSGLRTSLGVLIVVLSGCASGGPDFGPTLVSSQEDPSADFSAYGTYGYVQPLGTDEGDATRSVLSSQLVRAVDREMTRRGFQTSGEPDLLVDFYVLTQESRVSGAVSKRPVRYRRGRYGQWRGHDTTTFEYTEGTLGIDLVDAQTQAVVWEGMLQGPMQESLDTITQERMNEVVRLVFEPFDHQVK